MTFDDALTHLGTEDVLHEDALDKHVSQDPSSWSATAPRSSACHDGETDPQGHRTSRSDFAAARISLIALE